MYEVLQLLWDDGIKTLLIRAALPWATHSVWWVVRDLLQQMLMGVWSNNVRITHTRRAWLSAQDYPIWHVSESAPEMRGP